MKSEQTRTERKPYYDEELTREAVGKLFESAEAGEIERPRPESVEDEMTDGFLEVSSDDYLEYSAKLRAHSRKKRDFTKSPGYRERQRPETTDLADEEIAATYEPAVTTRTRKYQPENLNELDDDSYDDNDEPDGYPVMDVLNYYKYPIIGLSFLILIIFGILIFRINAVNAEYQAAMATIEDQKPKLQQLSEQTIELESLSGMLVGLNDEIDRLNQELAVAKENAGTNVGGSEVGGSASATAPNTSNNSNAQTQTPNTHTVVSGDSFGSIAVTYFGDGTKGEEIMAKNGYSNPAALKIGDVITLR